MNPLTKEEIKAFRKAKSAIFKQLEIESPIRGEIELITDLKPTPPFESFGYSGDARYFIKEVYSRISSYSEKKSWAYYHELFCQQSPEYQTFVACLKVGDELQMEFIHDGKGTPAMKEDGYHVDQFLIKIYRKSGKSPKILTFSLDTLTYKYPGSGMCK